MHAPQEFSPTSLFLRGERAVLVKSTNYDAKFVGYEFRRDEIITEEG
jgi:hypothetical protein